MFRVCLAEVMARETACWQWSITRNTDACIYLHGPGGGAIESEIEPFMIQMYFSVELV